MTHEDYELTDNKTVRRTHQPDEEEMTPAEALKHYRGLLLRMDQLAEDLTDTLAKADRMRDSIDGLLEGLTADAHEALEQAPEWRQAEDLAECVNKARRALTAFEQAEKMREERSGNAGEGKEE